MFLRVVCSLIFLAMAACNRDPETAKKKYVESGNRYYEKGAYKQASIMYRKALATDAKYGPAHYRMALTSLKLNFNTAAVQSLRRAVELLPLEDPTRRDALIKLSEQYLGFMEGSAKTDKEMIADIERTYSELLKADPNSFDGHRLKARMLFVHAQQAFAHRNSMDPDVTLESAIAEFRAAEVAKPGDPETTVYLSRSLSAARRYDDAEKQYRSLLTKKKDQISGYSELYRLLMFQNRPNEAEAVLKEAIANNPKQFDLLISLAGHYYSQKRREEVIKVLQELKSHAKEYPAAFERAGQFYFRLGDGAEAIRQYEEGILAAGGDGARKIHYQKLIIQVLMAQGKREEARKVNDEILAADSRDADALGMQASLLLEKGELQAAIAQLQTVVMRSPDNFLAHFNLGRALLEKGDVEPARQKFLDAIRLKSDFTPARLALGQLQLSRREFDAALKNADEAIAGDPSNVSARLIRTAALMGLNNTPRAREELSALLKANPSSQDALFQLGLLNAIEKNFKGAEEAYRRCYELNQGNTRGLMGQIESIMAQNQPDRAMQVLRGEIEKYPSRMEFRMALAGIAQRSGKPDMAIAEYRWLLARVDAKSAAAGEIYYRLGLVLKDSKGDIPGAIEALDKSRQLLPTSGTVVNTLAVANDQAGNKKQAREFYEATLRLDANNVIAMNNLAYLIASQPGGDVELALTYAQRARQKAPQNLEISDTLGLIYLKKNLPDNALEIFRDCLGKSPKNPTFRMHLGMALLQKGDKTRAKQELQTALTNRPTKEEETNIRTLLSKIG